MTDLEDAAMELFGRAKAVQATPASSPRISWAMTDLRHALFAYQDSPNLVATRRLCEAHSALADLVDEAEAELAAEASA